jgi:hypothetical protein
MPSDLEKGLTEALATISNQKKTLLRAIARDFDISYDTIWGRFHGRKPCKSNKPVNKAGLVRYIQQLDMLYAPCTLQEIERCANSILARSGQGQTHIEDWFRIN